MSKGYADYLVCTARVLDRALKRDADGVEVPLFRLEFIGWLLTHEQFAEGSIANYLTGLNNADELVCIGGKDFYTLFNKAFDACDYTECDRLIDWYKKLLGDEITLTQKHDPEAPKAIGQWLTSFNKYAQFLRQCMSEACDDAKHLHKRIVMARESARSLFLENRFLSWMTSPDREPPLAKSTATSYVRDIKAANNKIFCRSGKDFLAALPGLLRAKNEADILTMFTLMDAILTKRIDEADESEISLDHLDSARTALGHYSEFIKSLPADFN